MPAAAAAVLKTFLSVVAVAAVSAAQAAEPLPTEPQA
jgi:hypothetical protein